MKPEVDALMRNYAGDVPGAAITAETLWHSGETVGFRNVIVRYTKRQMTVVVPTNRNEPEPYQLALEIAKTVITSRSP